MEYIAQGIILQAKNFKDEDKIYYIFTFEKGLLRAVAKSVVSTKSKLSGFLMPGNLCIFMLAEARAFDKIAQVKTIHSYNISEDYKKFISFFKMSEILLNFLPESIEEHYIYNQSIHFLKDLESNFDIFDLEICYFLSIMNKFGFNTSFQNSLNFETKEMVNFCLNNEYLKNREMMIKLSYDKQKIYNYIKKYFEQNLEQKLNSF